MRFQPYRLKSVPRTAISDNILMLVMRKFDRELPLFFRPGWLARVVGLAEREACVFSGRGAHVTHRANGWASANERLTCEELLAVTAHAGVVIGKISHIGKFSFRAPRGRNFVASIARKALVLIRSMKEGGVFDRRSFRRLPLRSGLGSARLAASLRGSDAEHHVAHEHRRCYRQGSGERRPAECRRHEMFIAQTHE